MLLLLPSGELRRHQLLGLTRFLNLNANANAEAAIECVYNKSLHKDATAEVLFGLLSNFSLCLPYCLSASLSRFLYHTFFFSFCLLRNAIRRPMPALYRYSVTNSPWLRNNCKFNFAISRLAPRPPSSHHCLSVCLSVAPRASFRLFSQAPIKISYLISASVSVPDSVSVSVCVA